MCEYLKTTWRIENEPPVTGTDDDNSRKLRKVGRPSTAEQHEAIIRQWLEAPRKADDGPLKSIEVFTRLKSLGYEGGKTAVYDLVRRIDQGRASLH